MTVLLEAMRQGRIESDAGGIDVRLRNAASSDPMPVLGFGKSAQPGMNVLLEAMRQRRCGSGASRVTRAVLMCDCEMRRGAFGGGAGVREERTARNDCATGGDAAAAMRQRRCGGGDAAAAMRRRRCAAAMRRRRCGDGASRVTRAVCYQDDNRVSLRVRHVKMRPGHNPGPLG